MKLIVQIPCLNEAADIADVIRSVPREIEGIGSVEVLIIDDGSSDGTAGIAADAGADHIVVNKKTLGLARTFQKGITTALSLGADVILNTDGDGQYAGASIRDLELWPVLFVPAIIGLAAMLETGRRDPQAMRRIALGLGAASVAAVVVGGLNTIVYLDILNWEWGTALKSYDDCAVMVAEHPDLGPDRIGEICALGAPAH